MAKRSHWNWSCWMISPKLQTKVKVPKGLAGRGGIVSKSNPVRLICATLPIQLQDRKSIEPNQQITVVQFNIYSKVSNKNIKINPIQIISSSKIIHESHFCHHHMVELLPTHEGQGIARWHQHWRLPGPQPGNPRRFFSGDFWVILAHPTVQPPASTAEVVTLRFPKKLNQCKPESQMRRDWWHWNALWTWLVGLCGGDLMVLLGRFFSQKAGAIFCNSQHGCIGKSTAPCQIECLQNSCAKQVRLLPLWHVVTFNSMGGPLGNIVFPSPLVCIFSWVGLMIPVYSYFKLWRFSQHDTRSRSSHLVAMLSPTAKVCKVLFRHEQEKLW